MGSSTTDFLGARANLATSDGEVGFVSFELLEREGLCTGVESLPLTARILIENAARQAGSEFVSADAAVSAIESWRNSSEEAEVAFLPARVLLQDFTGMPTLVDLAAMRSRLSELGTDPEKLNPKTRTDMVIDHSVRVDHFARSDARQLNMAAEYERNSERYGFLRWAQQAFDTLNVVPPGKGICHQVNFERLASVVTLDSDQRGPIAFPDSVLGSDSHTTMINGLGVFGFGVGGIEIESAMLGTPLDLVRPKIVGLRLAGALNPGVLATDLVLTITQLLRQHDVLDRFVEVFGEGLSTLSAPDRGTVANMAPDFGANCCLFPVDETTLDYLRQTGRDPKSLELVERYTKTQGLFHTPDSPEPKFDEVVELDLSTVEPSLAGPDRPDQRRSLVSVPESFKSTLAADRVAPAGDEELTDGSVVIAAITSCTNTSNPEAMIAAGLLAKNVVECGLAPKPWVKTSLAPGSAVVEDYLTEAGLIKYLDQIGFSVVGFGCATCCGNSGELPARISHAIKEHDLSVASVLSGNRNYGGRIHSQVKANYLASPPLVVAYALAGTVTRDLANQPLGLSRDGKEVFLADVWPSPEQISEAMTSVQAALFTGRYEDLFTGDELWNGLPTFDEPLYPWSANSTYLRRPPFVDEIELDPVAPEDIRGARVLALLGDNITTDHISPVGAIRQDTPASDYLLTLGIEPKDFDSFGVRRGNYDVMVRGTFDNITLDNALVAPKIGGFTKHLPSQKVMSIFEASRAYAGEPLVIIAGKLYGMGSSRDWAARGTALLGVKAVLAESYERIHRSNLVRMGIVPLEFLPGESANFHGLDGTEVFDIVGLEDLSPAQTLVVVAAGTDRQTEFEVRSRIDTGFEVECFKAGGILPLILRSTYEEVALVGTTTQQDGELDE